MCVGEAGRCSVLGLEPWVKHARSGEVLEQISMWCSCVPFGLIRVADVSLNIEESPTLCHSIEVHNDHEAFCFGLVEPPRERPGEALKRDEGGVQAQLCAVLEVEVVDCLGNEMCSDDLQTPSPACFVIQQRMWWPQNHSHTSKT